MYRAPVSETVAARASLAELIASLSLAVDLGLGLPMEHVLRQTVIATRLSDAAGLGDSVREAVYYTSLLAWVGCTADSSELARLFGDDLRIRAASYETDLAGLPLLLFMVRNAGAGSSPLRRVALTAEILTTKVVEQSFASHCDSAAEMATQLGVGDDVVGALKQLFERWDGKGAPGELGGEELERAVRVLHLADIVEVYDRLGGVAAAVGVARERRGGMFDPALVDTFCEHADGVLAGLDDSSWDEVIKADPKLGQPLSDDQLDEALAALGDYADLKSPWWSGHSRGVADLAADAAARLGLAGPTVTLVRRAGFVHDIGVIGVSNAVWDRPAALTAADRERARTHPYLTEPDVRSLPRPGRHRPTGRDAPRAPRRLRISRWPGGRRHPAGRPRARRRRRVPRAARGSAAAAGAGPDHGRQPGA